LLATREAALADSVLATTLALGIDLDVVPDREELRRRWRTAPPRLGGPGAPRRKFIVKFNEPERVKFGAG